MSSKAKDGNVPESPAPSTWSTAGSGTRAILALLSKAGAHCEAPQGNILLCFPWMDIPSVGLHQRMLQTSERAARTAALLVPSIQRNPTMDINHGSAERASKSLFLGTKQTSGSPPSQGQSSQHGLRMRIPEKILMESTASPCASSEHCSASRPVLRKKFWHGIALQIKHPTDSLLMFGLKEQEFWVSWQNASRILASLENHGN